MKLKTPQSNRNTVIEVFFLYIFLIILILNENQKAN